jgi:hypothetical protein
VKSVAATRSIRSRTRRIASLDPINGAAPSVCRRPIPEISRPVVRSSSRTIAASCAAASIT